MHLHLNLTQLRAHQLSFLSLKWRKRLFNLVVVTSLFAHIASIAVGLTSGFLSCILFFLFFFSCLLFLSFSFPPFLRPRKHLHPSVLTHLMCNQPRQLPASSVCVGRQRVLKICRKTALSFSQALPCWGEGGVGSGHSRDQGIAGSYAHSKGSWEGAAKPLRAVRVSLIGCQGPLEIPLRGKMTSSQQVLVFV